MCIDNCLEYPISRSLKDQAEEDSKNITQQKGFVNASTVNLSERRDYVGSIAQNGLIEKIYSMGIKVEEVTPYFNSSIHQDEYDFKQRGARVDVKGSEMTSDFPQVYPNTRFLIKDKSKDKRVDYYAFVKVNLEDDLIHIAGIISYEDFWTLGQPFIGKFKNPSHFVLAKDLKPLMPFILGV